MYTIQKSTENNKTWKAAALCFFDMSSNLQSGI